MQTVFSMARLFLGCFALMWGVASVFLPPGAGADAATVYWLGLIVGAMGLAVTLQETAFIHSRFMRGDPKG